MAKVRLQQEFIECRMFGHQWERFQPLEYRRGYGNHIPLRCTRCTTERHDWIDQIGELNSRSYVYAEGYHVAKDERPRLQDLRLELISRVKKAQRS